MAKIEIYVVKSGDTLESIARKYDVPLSRIVQQNELEIENSLVVGQDIVITFPNQIYTVQAGDTLEQIANLDGVSVVTLLQNNPQLKGKSDIYPGQTIIIDYRGEKYCQTAVNGYIYPFVDKEILIKTLPSVSSLWDWIQRRKCLRR